MKALPARPDMNVNSAAARVAKATIGMRFIRSASQPIGIAPSA